MNKIRIKIKNSVVCLSDLKELKDESVRKELEDFDIATKTPIDCMNFVRKLKERYGRHR